MADPVWQREFFKFDGILKFVTRWLFSYLQQYYKKIILINYLKIFCLFEYSKAFDKK